VAEARAGELETENARLKEASRQDFAERRRMKSAAEEIEELKQQVRVTIGERVGREWVRCLCSGAV
jgi:hypothetical protein